MQQCKICGSFAICPGHHGRTEGVDLDLCDVCYWRKRAFTDDELEIIRQAFRALENVSHRLENTENEDTK